MDVYAWSTPNGYKPLIMLEECELEYTLKPVPLNGSQHKPEYLKINPNGKIPALVDQVDGKSITVFESGAMLIYLAEKTGKYLPSDGQARYEALQWLMFQMGGVGPMFGQYFHFKFSAPEKIPYGIKRYGDEAKRLYNVMERRLAESQFLAGDYSIADMATFPWAADPNGFGIDPETIPNVVRWILAIRERPAVARAYGAKFN